MYKQNESNNDLNMFDSNNFIENPFKNSFEDT